WPRRCSTISRNSSPSSVPPGSRERTTVRPSAVSHSASCSAWVDLPEPSPPSNVMKRPATLLLRRAGLLGSGLLRLGCRLRFGLRRALRPLVGEQLHRAIEVDLLDGLPARDRGVGGAIGDIRAEAPVLHLDRLPAL